MNNKKDFPFFKTSELSYLDSAATSQKPQRVIDALAHWYAHDCAPVHRGIYSLAERATLEYEAARSSVAAFIGAASEEIIFTKGTTESINFIAQSWAAQTLEGGDEIIVTDLEHHSNLLPWMKVARERNLTLSSVGIKNDFTLDYEQFVHMLSPRTKLVAFSSTSNVLGSHQDLSFMISHAHAVGAKVLIDAAQSIAHMPLDVHALDVDFLAFSGHKLLGPTGIGVLYIKKSIQELVPPYQVGGGMVFELERYHFSWRKPPHGYEAGTPPIAQAVGLNAALDYYKNSISWPQLQNHEALLCTTLLDELEKMPGVTVIGNSDQLRRSGHLVSFTLQGKHPHDVAAYLDTQQIAVRAGNQCAQPLHRALGLDGSLRVSFHCYSTLEDVAKLAHALKKLDTVG